MPPSRAPSHAAALALALAIVPRSAFAQQSLFNVPAGLGTAPGKIFAQEQATFTRYEGESNTTAAYGLTHWLEVGFNAFHVPLYGGSGERSKKPLMRAFTWNASVSVSLSKALRVFAGGAGGVGEEADRRLAPVGMGWGLLRWDAPGRFGSYVAGGYVGHRASLGGGVPAGGYLGAEIPILPEKLALLGDWVIGNNDVSVAVIGLLAFIGPSFQVCAGAQLPSPGSDNDYGGVLELTWVPAEEGRPHEHTR